MNFAAPIRTSAPLGPPAPIQLPKAETNGEKKTRKEEEDKPVETERRKEVLEEKDEEKVEMHSDIAPPPPAFDNHSPMKEGVVGKEDIIEEKNTAELKEDDEGVHHATVATVTGEGESTSLESYGTCAVALYDYQVMGDVYM